MIHIELINPRPWAATVETILHETWNPPCVHTSTAYLDWQFSFPGELPPLGVLATVENQPIGFASATPRRIRYLGIHYTIYIVSFVSVHKSWRNQGISREIYRTLLAEAGRRAPIVVFVAPDSAGERALASTCHANHYAIRPLGSLTTFACATASLSEHSSWVVLDCETPLLDPFWEYDPKPVIFNDPDEFQLRHYWNDPRGRTVIQARQSGQPSCAAMIVASQIRTNQGMTVIPSIDCLSSIDPSPQTLRDLAAFAAKWVGCDGHIVTAPNLSLIDPGVLRAAGYRMIPSRFDARLVVVEAGESLLGAHGTNLEVA